MKKILVLSGLSPLVMDVALTLYGSQSSCLIASLKKVMSLRTVSNILGWLLVLNGIMITVVSVTGQNEDLGLGWLFVNHACRSL